MPGVAPRRPSLEISAAAQSDSSIGEGNPGHVFLLAIRLFKASSVPGSAGVGARDSTRRQRCCRHFGAAVEENAAALAIDRLDGAVRGVVFTNETGDE